MVVRELVTKWGLDVDDKALKSFEKGIERAKANVEYLVASTAALGATLFGLSVSAAKFGDEVAKSARRLGIGTTELQEYEYAAKIAGISSEELVGSLQRLQVNLSKTSKGEGGAVDLLYKMGVNVRDANGNMRPLASMIPVIARGLQNLGSQAERLEAMRALFGRGGLRMLSVFGDPKQLEALRKEAHQLGGVLDEEAIANAEEYHDNLERILYALTGLKNFIGSQLIKVFGPLVEQTVAWVKANQALIRSNVSKVVMALKDTAKDLFNTLKTGVEIVMKVIDSIGGLENAIRFAGIAFAAFLAITSIAALGGIAYGIGALVARMYELGAAAIFANIGIGLIPFFIGAAIVALGLLTEDVVAFFQGKESIFATIVDFFDRASSALANIGVMVHNILADVANFGNSLVAKVPFIGKILTSPEVEKMSGFNESDFKARPGSYYEKNASSSVNNNVNVNVTGLDPSHAQKIISGALDDALKGADLRSAHQALGLAGAE